MSQKLPRQAGANPQLEGNDEALGPESEIKVTIEMIRAGTNELARYDPAYLSLEEGVCAIYRAMKRLEDA